MANWSELPRDLLDQILIRLSIPDVIRFGAVCIWWGFAAGEMRRRRPSPYRQNPWLMFSSEEPATANFFSVSEKKVYAINQPEPEICRRLCIGSSHGWLVTVDERSEIQLLNPVTGAQIQLPSVATFDHIDPVRDSGGSIVEYTVRENFPRGLPPNFEPYDISYPITVEDLRFYLYEKAVLSSSPGDTGDYTVMLIHYPDRRLALARAGDNKWTSIRTGIGYHDIIYHNDRFYTLDQHGRVESWNLSGPVPKPSLVMPKPDPGFQARGRYFYKYLVSSPSGGDLLQIWREREADEDRDPDDYKTLSIRVYKIDPTKGRIFQVKSLGDHALFLGGNLSICLSSADELGLRSNCIYFTDDHLEVSHWSRDHFRDIGIYHLEDGSIEPVFPTDPRLNWPPPIWLTPSLS